MTALAVRFADPENTDARWRERFERGEAAWDELELAQPQRKTLERFARPVRDANGRRLGWVEIYHDVTSQRMMESRLFQSQRVAALGQLLSGIAHEINNPLTSIVGYAQLLLRRPGGPNRDADARRILEEAERASRIAKNLLLFAREAKLERTLVNLNEIAERTVALRSYEQRLENIRLERHLDPHLSADPGRRGAALAGVAQSCRERGASDPAGPRSGAHLADDASCFGPRGAGGGGRWSRRLSRDCWAYL